MSMKYHTIYQYKLEHNIYYSSFNSISNIYKYKSKHNNIEALFIVSYIVHYTDSKVNCRTRSTSTGLDARRTPVLI